MGKQTDINYPHEYLPMPQRPGHGFTPSAPAAFHHDIRAHTPASQIHFCTDSGKCFVGVH